MASHGLSVQLHRARAVAKLQEHQSADCHGQEVVAYTSFRVDCIRLRRESQEFGYFICIPQSLKTGRWLCDTLDLNPPLPWT